MPIVARALHTNVPFLHGEPITREAAIRFYERRTLRRYLGDVLRARASRARENGNGYEASLLERDASEADDHVRGTILGYFREVKSLLRLPDAIVRFEDPDGAPVSVPIDNLFAPVSEGKDDAA